jgi:hypothetical protein
MLVQLEELLGYAYESASCRRPRRQARRVQLGDQRSHRGPLLLRVRSHERFEASIPAGRHTLRLRSGRYSSRDHSFEVPDGEVANLQCHSAMIWPRYVISLVKTDWAISLRRV